MLVGYSAQQMFDLVDAVEAYPQFLPWCSAAEVSYRDQRKTRATLHINYHGAKQSFTTENTKEAPHTMYVRLVEGPFRILDGTWRFTALAEQACKIDFRLHYEFSSKLLESSSVPYSAISRTRWSTHSWSGRKSSMAADTPFDIEVIYALPAEQIVIALKVAPGTTVEEAMKLSGLPARFREIDAARAVAWAFMDGAWPATRCLHPVIASRSTGRSLPIPSRHGGVAAVAARAANLSRC